MSTPALNPILTEHPSGRFSLTLGVESGVYRLTLNVTLEDLIALDKMLDDVRFKRHEMAQMAKQRREDAAALDEGDENEEVFP